ncbi:hypothetical protein TNCV_4883301, partial [Trichonephila clavipes]
ISSDISDLWISHRRDRSKVAACEELGGLPFTASPAMHIALSPENASANQGRTPSLNSTQMTSYDLAKKKDMNW